MSPVTCHYGVVVMGSLGASLAKYTAARTYRAAPEGMFTLLARAYLYVRVDVDFVNECQVVAAAQKDGLSALIQIVHLLF